jgi:hypothetical protein
MTRLAGLILGVLFLVPIPHTEDFTGKWSGSFVTTAPDGTERPDRIVLNLKHNALELTGTAGPSDDQQWPLKGSVAGDKLTFDVTRDEAAMPIKFVLTFADGHLKGDAQAEFQGQKMSAKIDAQRAKTGF